jgi:hypothetical protein
MSSKIAAYIDGLDTASQRAREARSYSLLLRSFSDESIERALRFILANGIPPHGEWCSDILTHLSNHPNVLSSLAGGSSKRENSKIQSAELSSARPSVGSSIV